MTPFRRPLWALTLLTAHAAAMFPPSSSVNVMPRSPVSGLSGLSDERWGLGLASWSSVRARRRGGTRRLDNPLHEKTETWRLTFLADAPLGRRWTLAAALPFVRSRSSFDGGGDEVSGPGDALLLAKWSFFKDDRFGPSTRELQWLAGVEWPTGRHNVRGQDGRRLPAPQQPGSHSTDWVAGLAGAANLRHLSVFGDLTYKRAGGAAYRFGDVTALNAGVHRPVGPRNRLGLTAELNAEAAGRDRSSLTGPGVLADKTVRDSGHETVYLSPGVQTRFGRRWTAALAVQLPVYQNYRGAQLAPEANLSLSLHGRWGRHGG